MNNKKYKSAPLPFQGQKRNYLNKFKEQLIKYPNDATYVDLFGGSGLLSRTIKDFYPAATVIYNDYDNFSERINAIPRTNKIMTELRKIVKNSKRKFKLDTITKNNIINFLSKQTEFVDYITLSSSLLFSMNIVFNLDELKKQTLYNNIKLSDYNADGYLSGLEIVTKDYKALYIAYKENKNVVFLVDPPYLSTDCKSYKNYWKLRDYLDVLKILEGTKYFYFTSNKSSIVELCEWFGTNTLENPFKYAFKNEIKSNTSHNSSYIDIMLNSGWETTIS